MRFFRTLPPEKHTTYRPYRRYTRADFKSTCAYCFRHEDEAGGESHFVQDHFKPQHLPDVDPTDYLNLYWSCVECNAPQHKGRNWPTPSQLALGEAFCDSCDHDPVGTDYVETEDHTLRTLTPAGAYTNRHLRLSVRQSLIECRQRRKRIRAVYRRDLKGLRRALDRLLTKIELEPSDYKGEQCRSLATLVAEYQAFVDREPFMLHSIPPEIPSVLIADLEMA